LERKASQTALILLLLNKMKGRQGISKLFRNIANDKDNFLRDLMIKCDVMAIEETNCKKIPYPTRKGIEFLKKWNVWFFDDSCVKLEKRDGNLIRVNSITDKGLARFQEIHTLNPDIKKICKTVADNLQ
jgi:hypothetical protein